MNFLMQDCFPLLDFQNQLLHAREFWKWKSPSVSFRIETFREDCQQHDWLENPRRWCPVGTVEFCEDWMKRCNLPLCKPINIPESLIEHFDVGRSCFGLKSSSVFHDPKQGEERFEYAIRNGGFAHCQEVYLKSNTKIKDDLNGFYPIRDIETKRLIFENDLQITTKMQEVKSEWRCFVFNEKLLDIKCYLGDPFAMPEKTHVEAFIKTACKSKKDHMPCAFTIDLMVCTTYAGELPLDVAIPLEAHDFFACGLYGFDDNYHLPLMLWEWWLQHVMRNSEQAR